MIDVPDNIQTAVSKEFTSRYPDFNGSEENAALMRQAVEELVEAGRPFSTDTLALAYHHLRASGSLEQPKEEIAELSDKELVHQRRIEHLAQNAESMTDQELEKNLRSAGIYVSSRGTI